MPALRKLSRDSAHRRAMLRNMATSLIQHEVLQTTWPKAKETQRWVDKLITLGKRNTNASRNSAMAMIFEQTTWMPKIFGELAQRYKSRPGGYTRVLRTESHRNDAADSAILSLVDGPRDIKFAMTAKALAFNEARGEGNEPQTVLDMHKVTRFRENGEEELQAEIERLRNIEEGTTEAEQEAFESNGTQFEWVRAHKKAGPGHMRKKRIDTGVPGEDPADLVDKAGYKGRSLNLVSHPKEELLMKG
ncbi:54S ribosomal protein L8, mitochondrial [Cyphellophora attinorum]|uniref:54S ribosomal protein L8, mitochondrial n=1 Tax=Cyphellophora attinorum TaxID=1664694 RepID=A0A0N1HQH5_9EURO|nr:54S ribosomal protein L8, mitochondrial [Phialophora attinorum]KPI37760.1 54S ribosomal protein L8, mitochondrial [Phialophora attinorum]